MLREEKVWHIEKKKLWLGNVKKRYHFGNQDIDGRIILHLLLQGVNGEGVDRVNLAQDVIKWRAVVNMAMNLLVDFYVPVRCYVASLVNSFATFRDNVASQRQGSKRLKFSPLKMRPLRFLEPFIQ
jgi:hypothetical protein